MTWLSKAWLNLTDIGPVPGASDNYPGIRKTETLESIDENFAFRLGGVLGFSRVRIVPGRSRRAEALPRLCSCGSQFEEFPV